MPSPHLIALIVKLRPKADARHDKNRWAHLQREFLCFIGVGWGEKHGEKKFGADLKGRLWL